MSPAISSPLRGVPLSEALVMAVEPELRVRLVDGPELTVRSAVMPSVLSVGDRVLVLQGGAERYVVGVLHTTPSGVLRTTSGATACVAGDTVTLHDAAGRMLLGYDASTGALTLTAMEGDLHVCAPRGHVAIEAGTTVTLRGHRLEGDVREARWSAGRWELRAARVVERASQVLYEVEDAITTRTGRVRTIVRGAYDLLAGRAKVVSREDTVVDGKRVLLG